MLQAIYTVLLQGKLGRSSIIYGYCLCVHTVFCLAGLKWRMSYKLPKWQRWRNKRGESWKTTIFHFCVVISCLTAAFMFLSYTSASLHPALFMILPTKKKVFGFCRCGLCCGITLQTANMKHSFFTNIRTRYLHQEALHESIRCRFCSKLHGFFKYWVLAHLTIDLLLQLIMT